MRAPVHPLRLAAALACALTLLALQLWLVGLHRGSDFAAGALFNASAIALVWTLFELWVHAAPRASWLLVLFYPLLVASCGLVFAHTWFYDVAVERRLTVLDMTGAGVWYFFSVALPPSGSVSLLALYAGLATLARAGARWLPPIAGWRAFASVLALWGVTWIVGANVPRVTSPLYDSALEQWEMVVRPKLRAGTAVSAPRLLAQLDKSPSSLAASGTPGATASVRYGKVIVLVMETMTADKFARETEALPPSAFVARERAHLQRYERYFPNNQDSRTGMLDMLFARLVPYEAYSERGYEHYRELAGQRSLVDRMGELGYSTAFAVSQTTLEDVVGELPWTTTLRLSETDIARAKKSKQLCFAPDEYESSCEDLVLLPALLDFVGRHERAFVYQEFIWGHAAEYNEASGKSNGAYYAEYVDALLRGLAQRGLTDDTLIALTSDHGFRDKGRQHELEMYRVPLLFHAADLTARSDARLFSHTDFAGLLLERVLPGAASAQPNELAMIVGPTGQGHLFVVQPSGHMLVRHKVGLDLLITEQGRLTHTPSELLTLFRAYRARFDAQLKERVPKRANRPAIDATPP